MFQNVWMDEVYGALNREAPIPDHDIILAIYRAPQFHQSSWDRIYERGGTNSVLTCALVWVLKRGGTWGQNERLIWQTLDIGIMSGPTSGFKKNYSICNPRNKIIKKFAILLITVFLHEKHRTTFYFSKFGGKSLEWSIIWAPLP